MLSALLSLLMTFLSAPAFAHNAQAPVETGARVLVSSERLDRYGAQILVDGGAMPVSGIPELLSKFDSVGGIGQRNAGLPDASQPVQAIVIVPKNAPLSYRQEFLTQIKSALATHYRNVKYEIHESFVDLDADAAALWEQRYELNRLRNQPDLTQAQVALLELADNQVEQGLSDDQAVCESWFRQRCSQFFRFFDPRRSRINHPYNSVIAAHAVAMTKFGISSVVTLSKYGVNVSSVLISAVQGAITAAFGFNAKAWSQFCTSHEFPFFKETLPVKFYNRHGWLKSANINLLRSLGLSYIMRMAAYWSGQTVAGRPVETANSLDFFVQGMGIALPEIILDGLVDDGTRALELKGYLSDQNRKYLLWAISFIDTTMHTLFRIGNVEGAYAVATVSWVAKAGVWLTARHLRAKQNRFFIVSDLISEQPVNPQPAARSGRALTNFLWYVSGVGGITLELRNRLHGKYRVSDAEMVRQNYGLTERVTPGTLSDADLERLRSSPDLTKEDLRRMFSLRDSDPDIVDAMFEYRNRLLKDKAAIDPMAMCAYGLTEPG